MSGDWIKMRKSLLSCPQVVRIMSALQADRFRTLGGLFSAWCLLDEQTIDGKLEGYTAEVFDEFVGFPGLAAAMEKVGWLEIGEDFIAAPRFSEHNGQTAKRRAQDSVRKMSARCPKNVRITSGQNADQRREEKRREEISIKEENKQKKKPQTQAPPDVNHDHWNDWLAVRKAKRGGPVTTTVLDHIRREASELGWSLDKAIETCAARSWVGFEKEWVENSSFGNGKSQKIDLDDLLARR